LIQNDILNQLAMQMIKKDIETGAKIIIDIDSQDKVIIKKKAIRSQITTKSKSLAKK